MDEYLKNFNVNGKLAYDYLINAAIKAASVEAERIANAFYNENEDATREERAEVEKYLKNYVKENLILN